MPLPDPTHPPVAVDAAAPVREKDVALVRRQHARSFDACSFCMDAWPCVTVWALDQLGTARAENARLVDLLREILACDRHDISIHDEGACDCYGKVTAALAAVPRAGEVG